MIMMRRCLCYLVVPVWVFIGACSSAREGVVVFDQDRANKKINVIVNNRYFISLIYSDTLVKPSLYPINTPSGKFITRGYPLQPRPFERTYHPHHVGLWFNFGDVNGKVADQPFVHDEANGLYRNQQGATGESISFKHKVIIGGDLSDRQINKMMRQFHHP